MALRDLLEDFGQSTPPATAPGGAPLNDVDLEGIKLESFEDGYKAGWDDAIRAQSDDRTRIASDFAQNLQDLSFTYHEAYSHVLAAMTPLLDDMVHALLPALARDALGLHIVEQLHAQSRAIGNLSVEIVVAPENRDAVSALLTRDFGFPLSVVESDTIGEGQADIRFGAVEQQVDLTSVLNGINEAVTAFTFDNARKTAHG
ncbi:ABC transporter ATP-binding protein [Thalassococcus sp. BH17M4-6]|uniref:ABC transporter ATP-binding protein n=1 Tax=Thalassococcus sp. BH17M4-6 TaxID=3413148 RepID=UPI003BBE9913